MDTFHYGDAMVVPVSIPSYPFCQFMGSDPQSCAMDTFNFLKIDFMDAKVHACFYVYLKNIWIKQMIPNPTLHS